MKVPDCDAERMVRRHPTRHLLSASPVFGSAQVTTRHCNSRGVIGSTLPIGGATSVNTPSFKCHRFVIQSAAESSLGVLHARKAGPTGQNEAHAKPLTSHASLEVHVTSREHDKELTLPWHISLFMRLW